MPGNELEANNRLPVGARCLILVRPAALCVHTHFSHLDKRTCPRDNKYRGKR